MSTKSSIAHALQYVRCWRVVQSSSFPCMLHVTVSHMSSRISLLHVAQCCCKSSNILHVLQLLLWSDCAWVDILCVRVYLNLFMNEWMSSVWNFFQWNFYMVVFFFRNMILMLFWEPGHCRRGYLRLYGSFQYTVTSRSWMDEVPVREIMRYSPWGV